MVDTKPRCGFDFKQDRLKLTRKEMLMRPQNLLALLLCQLLLAGPAGAYITGSVIGVDGGLTLSTL